jgi:hypothetical protein
MSLVAAFRLSNVVNTHAVEESVVFQCCGSELVFQCRFSPAFYLNADPDPDPHPGSQISADTCGSRSVF